MEIATRKGRMKSVVNKERRTEGINIDDSSSFFFYFDQNKVTFSTNVLPSHNFFFKSYAFIYSVFPSSIHFFIKVYRSDDKNCRRGYN